MVHDRALIVRGPMEFTAQIDKLFTAHRWFTAQMMNTLKVHGPLDDHGPNDEELLKILVFWWVFEVPSKLIWSNKGKGVFKSERWCS